MNSRIVITMIVLLFVQSSAFAHKISATGFNFTAASDGQNNDNLPGMKTITNTVENGTNTDRMFQWNVSQQAYFAGKVEANKTAKTTFQTVNPTVELPGMIGIENVGAFNASAHQIFLLPPPPDNSIQLESKYSVISGSVESLLMQFISKFTMTSVDLFEYEYDVMTSSLSPVSFIWDAAGLSGMVSSSNPFSLSFISNIPAIEIYGNASFTLAGVNTTIVATAVKPIPEPSTLVLFFTGFLGIASLSRRRAANGRNGGSSNILTSAIPSKRRLIMSKCPNSVTKCLFSVFLLIVVAASSPAQAVLIASLPQTTTNNGGKISLEITINADIAAGMMQTFNGTQFKITGGKYLNSGVAMAVLDDFSTGIVAGGLGENDIIKIMADAMGALSVSSINLSFPTTNGARTHDFSPLGIIPGVRYTCSAGFDPNRCANGLFMDSAPVLPPGLRFNVTRVVPVPAPASISLLLIGLPLLILTRRVRVSG